MSERMARRHWLFGTFATLFGFLPGRRSFAEVGKGPPSPEPAPPCAGHDFFPSCTTFVYDAGCSLVATIGPGNSCTTFC